MATADYYNVIVRCHEGLLSDTKLAEDSIQDILGRDRARQFSQCIGGDTKVHRDTFCRLISLDGMYRLLKGRPCAAERLRMAEPRHGRRFRWLLRRTPAPCPNGFTEAIEALAGDGRNVHHRRRLSVPRRQHLAKVLLRVAGRKVDLIAKNQARPLRRRNEKRPVLC